MQTGNTTFRGGERRLSAKAPEPRELIVEKMIEKSAKYSLCTYHYILICCLLFFSQNLPLPAHPCILKTRIVAINIYVVCCTVTLQHDSLRNHRNRRAFRATTTTSEEETRTCDLSVLHRTLYNARKIPSSTLSL